MATKDKRYKGHKNNSETLESLEEIILSDCKDIITTYNIEDKVARAIISQTIEASQFFTHALWHFYDVVRENYPNIFNIISPKGFLLIIQHLRRLVFQKIENRNVGASIILFTSKEQIGQLSNYHLQVSPLKNTSGDIKNFFKEKELDLVRAYKGIKSDKAFFAFVVDANKNTIKYNGIKAFGDNSFETICGDDAIGFNLSEGVPCIRIYNQGDRIVDYTGSQYDNSSYKSLVNDYNCGSRHEKAARYACEHPNDCVIVVSENRSISILHGDTPIYWRDVSLI